MDAESLRVLAQVLGGIGFAGFLGWLVWRDNRRGDVAATKSAIGSLNAALERADKQGRKDAEINATLTARVEALEADNADLHRQQYQSQRLHHMAMAHIRALRDFISEHLPGVDPPAAPPELNLPEGG